jgi:hypothetical protein
MKLNVTVIEPLDASGDVVKRAGSLELEALEPAAAGQHGRRRARQAKPCERSHRWLAPFRHFRRPAPGGLRCMGRPIDHSIPPGARIRYRVRPARHPA